MDRGTRIQSFPYKALLQWLVAKLPDLAHWQFFFKEFEYFFFLIFLSCPWAGKFRWWLYWPVGRFLWCGYNNGLFLPKKIRRYLVTDFWFLSDSQQQSSMERWISFISGDFFSPLHSIHSQPSNGQIILFLKNFFFFPAPNKSGVGVCGPTAPNWQSRREKEAHRSS